MLLKIVAWILIGTFALQFFSSAPWLVLLFSVVAAGFWLLSKHTRSRLEKATLAELGDQPLGNILDELARQRFEAAEKLVGDGSYDFEVVEENFYSQNFNSLQRNLNLGEASDWDEEAILISDPANNQSTDAVAVFVSGLKVGYVPHDKSVLVNKFLLQNGGFAKADAALYFSESGNSIWLDVVRPLGFRREVDRDEQ
ncbi:MAG: hypothetical protein ACKOXT_02320 [Actinomycetota bacterium]